MPSATFVVPLCSQSLIHPTGDDFISVASIRQLNTPMRRPCQGQTAVETRSLRPRAPKFEPGLLPSTEIGALAVLREMEWRYGAFSTCRQAAGRSAILGPGRGFDGVASGIGSLDQ